MQAGLLAPRRWVIADPHFNHAGIIKFKKPDGTPIRPGFTQEPMRAFTRFTDIGHHDETLVRRCNDRVSPHDRFYILGDFGNLKFAPLLQGRKVLILGNHDEENPRKLGQCFPEVCAWRVFYQNDFPEFDHPVVFTHFPMHPDVDTPTVRKINVHGHIHEKEVMRERPGVPGLVERDPWYINVSVEHTNHAPMAWDSLVSIVNARAAHLRALGEIQ